MHTKEWHEERRKGVGGSDLQHILNLEPYGCAAALWDEKRGIEPDYPAPLNHNLARGTRLEAVVAELYEEKTGYKLLPAMPMTHSTLPFIRGEADRLIKGKDPAAGLGLLEIKCPNRDTFFKYMEKGLPEAYILQIQHYFALYGAGWGEYAIFCADLWELETFRVNRDDVLIESLITAEENFWRQVEFGPRPERLTIGDDRCKSCVRRKSCWQDLVERVEEAKSLKKDDEILDITPIEGAAAAMEKYEAAKAATIIAEDDLEAAENEIKALMGECQAIRISGHKIYWKPQITNRLNAKRLEADHPSIAAAYKEKSLSRPFRIF